MYDTAFPLVLSCWRNDRSWTSPERANCGMEFSRAIFNFSSKGSFLDCDNLKKEVEIENGLSGERFLMDELSQICEFSEDNIAAPTRNADLSKELSMQSCETVVSSNDVAVQDNILETVSMLGTSVEDSMDVFSIKDETSLEWLSSCSEDALIYGASKFGLESFLLNSEDTFADGSISLGGGATSQFDQNCKDFDSARSGTASCETTLNCGTVECSYVLPTAVPCRARSKRPRLRARAAWSSPVVSSRRRFSPTNSLDSTSDVLYVSKPDVLCASTNLCRILTCVDKIIEDADVNPLASDYCSNSVSSLEKHSKKRKWKKGVQDSAAVSRRCTHCLSQKTPQWRLGPTGPKTLCNACGVRFKSGRLFPEYRPAKSPTFLSDSHSNSHKKVLEMRHLRGAQKRIQQGEDVLNLKVKLPREDLPTDSTDAHARSISSRNLEFLP